MKTYSFDLSEKKLKIKSIVLKETTGLDEAQAIDAAKAKKDTGLYLFELIRLSVVEVDGKPVNYPYIEYDRYTKKTQKYIEHLFHKINGIVVLGSQVVEPALTPTLEADDTYTFNWSKVSGAAYATVTLREVSYTDQVKAGQLAANKNKEAKADVSTPTEELVGLSVVKVNGKPVSGIDTVSLNSRTRNLLLAAYNSINSPMYEDSFGEALGDLPEVLDFLG